MFDGKVILVTGGTGSFGKYFIRNILERFSPQKVIVYSRDEMKQFEMGNMDFYQKHQEILRYFIGDVRDLQRLSLAMGDVDYVVHSAALKQVPAAEYNPFEAVKTNVMGSQNVIDAALESNVEKVILLSTDKACAPINLYGATKLTAEKLFVAANNYKGKRDIKYSAVRYGNVMGSRGSVIPFFLKQKSTGVIPITDKDMTRFNLTLQEGVDFVISSMEIMKGGEVFVPKIPSLRIMDLAKAIAPECKIKVVGIRPGEKLHEELVMKSEARNTIDYGDKYIVYPQINSSNNGSYLKSVSLKNNQKYCKKGFSYNSNNNNHFLTIDELKTLIENIEA